MLYVPSVSDPPLPRLSVFSHSSDVKCALLNCNQAKHRIGKDSAYHNFCIERMYYNIICLCVL